MQVTYFPTVIYYVIHVAKTVITVFTGLKVIIRNALNIDLLVIILVSSMKKQRLNRDCVKIARSVHREYIPLSNCASPKRSLFINTLSI